MEDRYFWKRARTDEEFEYWLFAFSTKNEIGNANKLIRFEHAHTSYPGLSPRAWVQPPHRAWKRTSSDWTSGVSRFLESLRETRSHACFPSLIFLHNLDFWSPWSKNVIFNVIRLLTLHKTARCGVLAHAIDLEFRGLLLEGGRPENLQESKDEKQ